MSTPMRTLLMILVATSCAVCASAQDVRIERYSINSGGGQMEGGNLRLSCTIGQPVAGFVNNANILHWVGFWTGDDAVPTVVTNLSRLKLLADGAYVSVAGKIATSAQGDFSGFFYIEEPGRFSGIRVAASPSSVSGLIKGSVVNVIGTLSTTATGERQISGPLVIITSTTSPLAPVGMPGRNIGGGDFGKPPAGQVGVTGGTGLNNVGLLVKTWGRVVSQGPGYVDIDDGSGPVRLDVSGLVSPPAQGTYVSVIGISSLYQSGGERLRLLLIRAADTVKPE